MTQNPWLASSGGSNVGLYIGLAIAVIVLLLRNQKPRSLRIELLWIRPLIFMGLMAAAIIALPPAGAPLDIALLTVAAVIGAGIGWQRGRFIHIEVHPETHALTTRVSPLGLAFIVAIIALRMGLRGVTAGGAGAMPISTATASDALIVLAGVMMVVQSLEMWLRARRLLAEARRAGQIGGAIVS